MSNLVMYKKGEKSKIRYIKRRLSQENGNWLELMQGASGSGKTWSAISESKSIDPNFDVSKQLVFTFQDFMKLINSEWFKELKIKIIIFDEPQIQMSNRAWQSVGNRLINYVLSTFRHQNICVIFCCPYRDFLDSQSMKMIHCVTEMKGIDRKKGLTKTRPKLQQYNSQMKKTYEHSLQIIRDGTTTPLIFDFISKPNKEDVEIYEMMKSDYTSTLNKSIEVEIDKINGKDKKEEEVEEVKSEFAGKKKIEGLQLQIYYCWKEGLFKVNDIATKLNKKYKSISKTIITMRNKGHFQEDHIGKTVIAQIHPIPLPETS